MSDDRLPADLSAWPRDVYELLGVRRGVSRRELRKAYTALLRQFKPEHHPDHFRRIRDAYEAVLRNVEWQERQQPPAPEEPANDSVPPVNFSRFTTIVDANAAANPSHPIRHSNEPPRANARRTGGLGWDAWHDRFETLWNQAVAGDRDAYERLAGLEPLNSERRELYVRLYWLLVVWPELDPRREPCDWLVRGTAPAGSRGRPPNSTAANWRIIPTSAIRPLRRVARWPGRVGAFGRRGRVAVGGGGPAGRAANDSGGSDAIAAAVHAGGRGFSGPACCWPRCRSWCGA